MVKRAISFSFHIFLNGKILKTPLPLLVTCSKQGTFLIDESLICCFWMDSLLGVKLVYMSNIMFPHKDMLNNTFGVFQSIQAFAFKRLPIFRLSFKNNTCSTSWIFTSFNKFLLFEDANLTFVRRFFKFGAWCLLFMMQDFFFKHVI